MTLTIARTPDPESITSNIGHPSEPVVIGLRLDGTESIVTLAEGSGHLGSGGAFGLSSILTGNGELQVRWHPVFERAGALWVVPYLQRLAAGERVSEAEIVRISGRPRGR